MDAGNFGGFSVPGNFYTPASATLPYPGLDGHQRRITPIPVTPTLSQPSALHTPKSPEQLQREASELIQRLEKEKAEREEAAKKYREKLEQERRKEWEQMTRGAFGAKIEEKQIPTRSDDQSSGTERATIGNTTISTEQAEIIKKEVRETIAKTFPRIHMVSGSTVQPNPSQGTVKDWKWEC